MQIIPTSTQKFLVLSRELSGGIACDSSGLGRVSFRPFSYSFTQIHYFYSHHPAPPCSLERAELMSRKKSSHFFHTVLSPPHHMPLLSISSHLISFLVMFCSKYVKASSTERALRHDCRWLVQHLTLPLLISVSRK